MRGIARALLAVLLLVAILVVATPAYADTDNPDSVVLPPEINIYRNLIETGDWLVMTYANIPYAVLPDLPVTSTFIWRLMHTDNVTELGSTIGYAYNDDGYGYNVSSMYFSASTVTALGMVWGTTYGMRLIGNPAAFDTPPVYNFTINAASYSALTVQSEVQEELAARILVIAADLESKWGTTPGVDNLLTQNETATVLSTNGEAFFRGAIFGLQAMAPTIFSVIIRVINIEAREWDTEYSANLTAQWGGTWADTAQEAGKVLFGTTYDLLSLIMLFAMAGGIVWGNLMLTGDSWNAMVDVSLLGVIGARLGMIDLAYIGLVAFIALFYISAKIWFGLIK